MSPIPGEPLTPKAHDLTTSDGRQVSITIGGSPLRLKPLGTEERQADEPPRADPRPPFDPNHAG